MNSNEFKPVLVSIVIPVFNVADYLVRCLDSVKNQTISNIEVILIYDTSSDNSLEICDRYVLENNHFFLFRGPGTGVGAARNMGIDLARGRYLLFIDSDDWVERSICQRAVELMEAHEPDFLNFGFQFLDSGDTVLNKKLNFKNTSLSEKAIYVNSFLDNDVYTVIWNKCYSLAFLKKYKIYFPEVPEWEDVLFIRQVAYYAKNTIFCNELFYNALVRKNSRSRSITPLFFTNALGLLDLEWDFVQSNDIRGEYLNLYRAHYVKIIAFFLLKAAFESEAKVHLLDCFDVVNKSQYWKYYKNNNVRRLLPVKYRLFTIFFMSPNFFHQIIRILNRFKINTY